MNTPFRFKQIVIPNFIFTDGTVGEFVGFDRDCYPCDGVDCPRWHQKMGLFDMEGNYFLIHIDTRKKRLAKEPTYSIGGENFYHPITDFYTMGSKINPTNGHILPHNTCKECESFRCLIALSPKQFAKIQ